MIDNLKKTVELLKKIDAAVPIPARLSPELRKRVKTMFPDIPVPEEANVTWIKYMGDEGGILCLLESPAHDAIERPLYTSITYLDFGFRHPLSKEIRAYQQHRTKKLKKTGGVIFERE